MGNLVSRHGRKQGAGSSQRTTTLPQNSHTASSRNQQGCLPERLSQHPTKKALLIGIRYEKGRWPGKGSKKSMDLGDATHKEVQTWSNILMQHYGYREDEIICMQDNNQCSRNLWPSRENIIAQLEDLARGTKPGDRRFLFIAAHGDQRQCTSDQTELDGKDERTMMDLPFRLNAGEPGPPTLSDAKRNPKELQGNILCLSACEDSQQAYDFKHSSTKQGILTAVIGSSLGAARSRPPTLRVVDLLKGLVGICNEMRGDRTQQTPMECIPKANG
ncbi:hypothetical protein FS837_000919 [Tulasnella sp. UAMH 9824]|nr:hypothetical protein FS837_000919 [Tulasnella sp. UAMH 9824]